MHALNLVDPEEIAAILTCISVILGALIWALRLTIKNLTIDLSVQVKSLTSAVNTLTTTANANQRIEEQHYESHEKRLHDDEIDIGKQGTKIDDHEDRIKSNEEDIDYLKQQMGGKRNG